MVAVQAAYEQTGAPRSSSGGTNAASAAGPAIRQTPSPAAVAGNDAKKGATGAAPAAVDLKRTVMGLGRRIRRVKEEERAPGRSRSRCRRQAEKRAARHRRRSAEAERRCECSGRHRQKEERATAGASGAGHQARCCCRCRWYRGRTSKTAAGAAERVGRRSSNQAIGARRDSGQECRDARGRHARSGRCEPGISRPAGAAPGSPRLRIPMRLRRAAMSPNSRRGLPNLRANAAGARCRSATRAGGLVPSPQARSWARPHRRASGRRPRRRPKVPGRGPRRSRSRPCGPTSPLPPPPRRSHPAPGGAPTPSTAPQAFSQSTAAQMPPFAGAMGWRPLPFRRFTRPRLSIRRPRRPTELRKGICRPFRWTKSIPTTRAVSTFAGRSAATSPSGHPATVDADGAGSGGIARCARVHSRQPQRPQAARRLERRGPARGRASVGRCRDERCDVEGARRTDDSAKSSASGAEPAASAHAASSAAAAQGGRAGGEGDGLSLDGDTRAPRRKSLERRTARASGGYVRRAGAPRVCHLDQFGARSRGGSVVAASHARVHQAARETGCAQ